jgi:magnesium chelatase family protein
MLAKTYTGSIQGVDGLLVRVEVGLSPGIQVFRTVGLPDTSVREAEVRVCSALHHTGFRIPDGRVTVNLSPADVKKQGAGYDLAVALGVVAAMGQASPERLENTLFLGELALDGSLRPVRGVLPVVLAAAKRGLSRVVVPEANGTEAALVKQVSVHTARSLRASIDLVSNEWASPLPFAPLKPPRVPFELDLADVKGQRLAKRALEIAAAGGHNLLLVGPPGAGKSLLAMRLPSLLPPLEFDEALEVTKIYSVAGLLDEGTMVAAAPFRAPHHSISSAAMVGGGARSLPGEVSLAHEGVLFLDELPEFPRPALEALRQPMEEGRVRIRRVGSMASLPARFALVAAMNPCPCGFLGAEVRPCQCTPGIVQRYQGRISGPLLDRIDLRVPVRVLRAEEMLSSANGESSRDVRARVEASRRVQEKRFRRKRSRRLNSAMTPAEVASHCALDSEGKRVIEQTVERLGLSARGYHRVLKVARTIADLAGSERIACVHLQEAIHFQCDGHT